MVGGKTRAYGPTCPRSRADSPQLHSCITEPHSACASAARDSEVGPRSLYDASFVQRGPIAIRRFIGVQRAADLLSTLTHAHRALGASIRDPSVGELVVARTPPGAGGPGSRRGSQAR